MWEYHHFILPRQTIKSHRGRLAGISLLQQGATLGKCCRDVMTAHAQRGWWLQNHPFVPSQRAFLKDDNNRNCWSQKTIIPAVCLCDRAVTTRIASPTNAADSPTGPAVRPVWQQWKIINVVMINLPDNYTPHLGCDVHWWRAMWPNVGFFFFAIITWKMFCSEFIACPQTQPTETVEIYLQYGPVLWRFSYISSVCCAWVLWQLNHHLHLKDALEKFHTTWKPFLNYTDKPDIISIVDLCDWNAISLKFIGTIIVFLFYFYFFYLVILILYNVTIILLFIFSCSSIFLDVRDICTFLFLFTCM